MIGIKDILKPTEKGNVCWCCGMLVSVSFEGLHKVLQCCSYHLFVNRNRIGYVSMWDPFELVNN